MKKLTQRELKEAVLYNPWTGIFYRHLPTTSSYSEISTAVDSAGYLRVKIAGKRNYAHRLAWLYVYGYFPEHGLDHKNRIKTTNRIDNLREVSQMCNMRNMNKRSDNTSGITGVCWVRDRSRWLAQIKVNHINIQLGTHKEFSDAVRARWDAEVKYGFPNCNTSSTAYNYLKENKLINL